MFHRTNSHEDGNHVNSTEVPQYIEVIRIERFTLKICHLVGVMYMTAKMVGILIN